MARLHADGEVPTRKPSRVAVWAGCVFVLLFFCLRLPLAGHVVDAVYAGLFVSAAVALGAGSAWFRSLVWNVVSRWRHR